MNHKEDLDAKIPEELSAEKLDKESAPVEETETVNESVPAEDKEASEIVETVEAATEVAAAEPEAEETSESSTEEATTDEELKEKDAEAAAEEENKKDDAEAAAAEDVSPAETSEEPAEQKKKKKAPFIQIPVIISIGIVLVALIGYFVYSSFFMHKIEGIIWSLEEGDMTYYLEFSEDGICKLTYGAVEETCHYENSNVSGENAVCLAYDFMYLYAGYDVKYEITGSRILGNQEITFSYGEDTLEFTMKEVKEKVKPLELPTDFKADEGLLGEWSNSHTDGIEEYLRFNDDGSMENGLIVGSAEDKSYHTLNYYGTYTVTDGTINFTYYIDHSDVVLIDYKLDGDHLTFNNYEFVRVKNDATPDEA